jgi:short/branched chain acyl-CoA dehydrogenase
MDENEMMDPSIIKGLFEWGVCNPLPPFLLYLAHICHSSCGIETSTDHGGAESSFTSAIIAIEELTKVNLQYLFCVMFIIHS